MLAVSPLVRHPVAAPVLAGGLLMGGCVTLALVDPAGGPPVCPFKAATGLDCPGCGGTRAAHQLFTGHLGAALDFNVLAVLAMPFILWGLFTWLTRVFGGPVWRGISVSNRWTAVAVVVLLAFWVVRNLDPTPFAWLGTGT
ncbi:MAG: DUF2752 domain-containing protein [Actinobacteria bacterium]|nr:DUF2752 domain-containing protein [Actinomycetota bacterium]